MNDRWCQAVLYTAWKSSYNSQRLEVRIFEVLCVIFVDFSESCSFSNDIHEISFSKVNERCY